MTAHRPPWVLIAGGFHQAGGMDKANAALAAHLVEQEIPVHLVAHRVDETLAAHPGVSVHLVPRSMDSYFLGERALGLHGTAVARAVTSSFPGARVVVNGGNCVWPDINWVHCVHHAWHCADESAPVWFRLKNRLAKAIARRRERTALNVSPLIVANSVRTSREVVTHLGVDSTRVHTVYPGCDPGAVPPSAEERLAARAAFGVGEGRPCIVFVGALGHDDNKGLTTLWRAWRQLCARRDWDAELIIAGGGRAVEHWRARIGASSPEARARVLGFTERVDVLLAAVDLLVSPVRYEAYGLGVQEAVCRGVPALVSGTAGITERFSDDVRELVLSSPTDADELAARLLGWRSAIDHWRERFGRFGGELRRYTWTDMAVQIVTLAERPGAEACATRQGMLDA